jgi:hypothetical protein
MKSLLLPVLLFFSETISAQTIKQPVLSTIKTTATLKNVPVVYDFSKVQLCVDLPLVSAVLPPRDFSAVKPLPKFNSDGSLQSINYIRQPLAGETAKMWNPGETIKVYLNTINGSQEMFDLVKSCARKWEQIANVKFDFTGALKTGQIKIKFSSDKRYWSWLGRDVLANPFNLYTMNLGFLNEGLLRTDMERIILHEFGHALGFIHEHQSPAGGVQWHKEKVYQYYADEPNKWTRADVDQNVFNKYTSLTTNYSAYDPYSIMHYHIPPELTINGVGTPKNYSFSSEDIRYARMLYPFPPAPTNTTGILRTGDDCDMINFSVEYNAVAADKIEFMLELGRNQNNRDVTWWKQIALPTVNNREILLWVQNHSLIATENRKTASVQIPFAELDATRSISFWKAKFLGIHSILNYKWNAIPALKGGCRIKLVWNNDTCG